MTCLHSDSGSFVLQYIFDYIINKYILTLILFKKSLVYINLNKIAVLL